MGARRSVIYRTDAVATMPALPLFAAIITREPHVLVDAVAAPALPLSSRYCWRHVVSDEPYAAVLLPGEAGPSITTNHRRVVADDLPAVERWADACLGRGETIAFLSLATLATL